MSNWNPNLGQAMMTTATASLSAVNAERARVKVGMPCDDHIDPTIKQVFGALESISVEVAWYGHRRFPDEAFQDQTLTSKFVHNHYKHYKH